MEVGREKKEEVTMYVPLIVNRIPMQVHGERKWGGTEGGADIWYTDKPSFNQKSGEKSIW